MIQNTFLIREKKKVFKESDNLSTSENILRCEFSKTN